jgi:hypothetical protein
MEGGLDPNHSLFLHKSGLVNDPLFHGAKGAQYTLTDLDAKFEAVESEGGLLIGARRKAENGNFYWRVMHWVMPCFTTVAPRAAHPVHGHFWVPIDDEHCWTWSFDYLPTRELTDKEVAAMKEGHGVHAKLIPGTFRPAQNKDNDYLMDREAQRTGKTYSGVDGIGMQDSAMQESMGPIQDRTRENLVSTDNAVIMARQRLFRAARALAAGAPPPGLAPSTQRVRSASLVLPDGVEFAQGARDALIANPDTAPVSV